MLGQIGNTAYCIPMWGSQSNEADIVVRPTMPVDRWAEQLQAVQAVPAVPVGSYISMVNMGWPRWSMMKMRLTTERQNQDRRWIQTRCRQERERKAI